MTVHATCTNRDLPSRLPFGGEQGDFELEAQARSAGSAACASRPGRSGPRSAARPTGG